MIKIYDIKRLTYFIIVLIGFLLLGTINTAYASTVDHRFYIQLPDGSRQQIKGIIVHQIFTGAASGWSAHGTGEPLPWSEPRITMGQFDFCSYEGTQYTSWSVTNTNFSCATLASCHAEMFMAPYFPETFNDNAKVNRLVSYPWNSPSGVASLADEYKVAMEATFKNFNGTQTFTQKYPWFPFETGNPRGSSTAYWKGRLVNGCTRGTCVNNPIYFINYGNIPDNPGFGSRMQATSGFMLSWQRLPDYAEYQRNPGSGTKYARWYGPSDKPSWAGSDIAEVALDRVGGNVYKGNIEWTLIETNPIDLPECGDTLCNVTGETCDGNTKCSGGGLLSTGECRAPGVLNGCTYCGDGIVQTGEQCDDGNTNNTDTCSNSCGTLQQITTTTGTTTQATTTQGTTTNATTTNATSTNATTTTQTTLQTTTTGTTTGATTEETTTVTPLTTTGQTTASLPETGTKHKTTDWWARTGIILASLGFAIYATNLGESIFYKLTRNNKVKARKS